MRTSAGEFLKKPEVPGMFGALMDETARAADDFCAVVESVPEEHFVAPTPSDDPDTRSIRDLAAHAIRSAHRYADYIRKARGLPYEEAFQFDPENLQSPTDVRPRLREVLQYTEEALDGLHDASEDELAKLTFPVRWGPTYDPEMILEHGIVHLLRHRRQIERWDLPREDRQVREPPPGP